MEKLNRTLKNPVKIRFESKNLGFYVEWGSRIFDKLDNDDKAAKKLYQIGGQKTSGRSLEYKRRLQELSKAGDLKITRFNI